MRLAEQIHTPYTQRVYGPYSPGRNNIKINSIQLIYLFIMDNKCADMRHNEFFRSSDF